MGETLGRRPHPPQGPLGAEENPGALEMRVETFCDLFLEELNAATAGM
jgi:hypothetical protein